MVLSFIDYNKNISSLIMALCWLISVGALTIGLLTEKTNLKRSDIPK